MDGELEFETTSGNEYGEVRTDKPKLVRRRTWTKQDGDMHFQTQQMDDYRGEAGERVEVRRHDDNLRVEGEMEGRRGYNEDYTAVVGDRAVVTRRQDNLRLVLARLLLSDTKQNHILHPATIIDFLFLFFFKLN